MRLLELEEQTQSLMSKVNTVFSLPVSAGCWDFAHTDPWGRGIEADSYCKGFVRLIHALYRCLPSLGCKNAWRS